ncbi:hypothetical protein OU5_0966 [Pseudomonas mandelii JR-1]|uniref:Uncharacterized protein n=1 Tax=Pseudomonas mandelii JR-1 TaxID=1147786 RepID=A0A024E624_9PSED|nr:hypothetical protein OU5_0966 [Pseudomonas mandelii JR-1]
MVTIDGSNGCASRPCRPRKPPDLLPVLLGKSGTIGRDLG